MKKLLLSGGVIIIFLAYAWKMQQETAGVQVVAPQMPSPTTTQAVTPTNTPTTSTSGATPPMQMRMRMGQNGQYKDGTYTGSPAELFTGIIQVQVTISGGKLTNVTFLQSPSDSGTSVYINSQAMPYFKQEALAAQSANVDTVSGATESSIAFQQSLASALSQAKN